MSPQNSTRTFGNMLASSAVVRRMRLSVALVSLVIGIGACGGNDVTGLASNPASETYASVLNVNIANMTKLNNNVFTQDSIVGTGTELINGKTPTIVYAGYFTNGAKFDAGTISTIVLGSGQLVPGFEQGLVGMKVGGWRKIVIGSTLAYGPNGNSGIIPPNATLIFNVNLTAVQ